MRNFIAILLFLVLLSIGFNVEAHPGRTDANGGHTCRTNCEKYGLDYGEYHYHNGGGNTGSTPTTSTSAPSRQSNDKDCGDFGSYEEVVQYWNSKGYSATNDPENLDGWGNGQVDDGIPCEPPSGYDTTKINGSPAQIAAQTAKKEKEQGEADGYADGVEAGYQDESDRVDPDGSDAYIEGYQTGFSKGLGEGQKELKTEKEKANKAGHDLGTKQDELKIPDEYTKNKLVEESFEEGFEKAVKEREEAQKKEFYQKGFEEGKKDKHNVPKNLKEIFIKVYEEGYQKGQDELKATYVKQGYDAAFTLVKYMVPEIKNEKYVKWYKEGFDSNEEVKGITKEAYALGLEGSTYNVPDEYKHAVTIFEHHYEQGLQEYEKEKAEKTKQAATGIGVVVLGWVGRRLYVAKKMVS